jgi:hypothetical protein
MGTVKDRPRRDRNLITACFALIQGFPNRRGSFSTTPWADKPVRPTEREKIVDAPRYATKSRFKFHQIPGIILHALKTTYCGMLSQVDTPISLFIIIPSPPPHPNNATPANAYHTRSRLFFPSLSPNIYNNNFRSFYLFPFILRAHLPYRRIEKLMQFFLQ